MDLFGIKRRDKKLHEYIKNGIASIATPKEIYKELSDKEKKHQEIKKLNKLYKMRNKVLIKLALWLLNKVDQGEIEYKNSWEHYKNKIESFLK